MTAPDTSLHNRWYNSIVQTMFAEKYKVTATFGFDSRWQGLFRAQGFSEYGVTVCKAVLAGEPRSYDLVKGMRTEGVIINNLYARTENGPAVPRAGAMRSQPWRC